jgi:hypothetical protein
MPVGQLGNVEPVPVDDGGLVEAVAEADPDALSATEADDGAEVRLVHPLER